MSDDSPGFVEQRLFLPRRLWERVEAICATSGRQPGEVVADALGLLLSGGLPMAPASVGGTLSAAQAPDPTPAMVEPGDGEDMFAAVRDEPIDSDRLRQTMLRAVHGVEQRDQFPDGHAEAVAELSRALAESIGLDATACRGIELAALAHDLGKNRLAESILGKQGRLTPEEWNLVRRYPEFSAEMIGQCTHLAAVAKIVRHHQERWDGSGYPDRLAGDDIPVGAQIVGICDVFHVLTSERAYRPALSPEIARRTIEGGAGRLWNPELAAVFLEKVVSD